MTDQLIRRAAVYLRVSTLQQETENQLLQAARFIEANGWQRVELVDHGSGKDAERAKFQELFSLAARRETMSSWDWLSTASLAKESQRRSPTLSGSIVTGLGWSA